MALVEVDLANRTAPPVLLADELHSQIKMHQPYGGVVPELASRAHQQNIVPVVSEALRQAPTGVIAYTSRGWHGCCLFHFKNDLQRPEGLQSFARE